ncbi:hypothetical protein [Pseudonocardia asaccharolytica]|uniref:hypothetical protein n=1 Tax=Pseudonocardia asaccharolytica TaxID=54010 RepID=UPI000414E432|nr:hypothetical protein [Pseudonocardia asaccharolytica]
MTVGVIAQPVVAGPGDTGWCDDEESVMINDTEERRLVGIDLGIASDHTGRVLDGRGGEVCRRRARPTGESLAAVEAAARAGAPAGRGWRW